MKFFIEHKNIVFSTEHKYTLSNEKILLCGIICSLSGCINENTIFVAVSEYFQRSELNPQTQDVN